MVINTKVSWFISPKWPFIRIFSIWFFRPESKLRFFVAVNAPRHNQIKIGIGECLKNKIIGTYIKDVGSIGRGKLAFTGIWVNSKFNKHYYFNPAPKYGGIDIFTAADAWLINSRNQDSNIPHHLAGSCTWAHTAHFRIHNLSRRNFHFPLECSIVVFSYFHDPQKIHWQKHWELEECPAPAPALGTGYWDWVWHHGHKKAVSPIQWCTGPQSHRVTSLPSRRILSPEERIMLYPRNC